LKFSKSTIILANHAEQTIVEGITHTLLAGVSWFLYIHMRFSSLNMYRAYKGLNMNQVFLGEKATK